MHEGYSRLIIVIAYLLSIYALDVVVDPGKQGTGMQDICS